MPPCEWMQQIDSWVSEANSKIGLRAPAPLFPESPYRFATNASHVTPGLIRASSRASGDPNPLWNDAAYGATSPWGTNIAPPVFEAALSECGSVPQPPPVPGMVAMQGGVLRRYFEPFRPGDVIRSEDIWHGIEEKTRPEKPYRLFINQSERVYINQYDRMVVSARCRIAMIFPKVPGEDVAAALGFAQRARRRFSEEELEQVRANYRRVLCGDARRGAEPRYWEDVNIGDVVPELLFGPYDMSDAVTFAGAIGVTSAGALKWREIEPAMALFPRDPETGAPRHLVDVHFEEWIAQTRGLRHSMAFGTQLEQIMCQAVSNWMSDSGFICEADMKIHSALLFGEISRTTGRVTGKRRDGDRCLVDLQLASETWGAVPYCKGNFIVELSSRAGQSPAARLLAASEP